MSTNTVPVAPGHGTWGTERIRQIAFDRSFIIGLATAIILGVLVISGVGAATGRTAATGAKQAVAVDSPVGRKPPVASGAARQVSPPQNGSREQTIDRSAEVTDAQAAVPSTPSALLPSAASPTATDPSCVGGYARSELNGLLHDDSGGAGGITGADYARAQILPDGRVLWVFQDVFVGGGGNLHDASFTHNAGLIQNGTCFELLRGEHGGSWIGGDIEDPLDRWFWPLDSVIDVNGQLAQFVVEMRNPNGSGAFEGAEPVGVWIASISLTDFTVVDLQPAPDSGDRPLYGFSITSDDQYNYLYGNCYRQFADPGFAGFLHDTECGPLVYVARIPIGQPEVAPEYWTGATWSPQRNEAVPIAQGGDFANPMQVRRMGDRFVSATKVDDWWGHTIVVEVATSPEGPFIELNRVEVPALCDACNTYFAHVLPWTGSDGSLLVAVSNNAWDMVRDAYPHPELYRPSVLAISLSQSLGLVDGRQLASS